MSFTQTDDAALEAFPVGFSLSPPVLPALFFFFKPREMWGRFSWRYSRSEMSKSVFLSVGDVAKQTWVCWDSLPVSSGAPGLVFCLWSQSLRHDPAVPTPTGCSAPFLPFFFFPTQSHVCIRAAMQDAAATVQIE